MVYWTFPSLNANSVYPNRVLVYNYRKEHGPLMMIVLLALATIKIKQILFGKIVLIHGLNQAIHGNLLLNNLSSVR